MFLRASRVEAEAAGESTEGMANSVSELRDKLLALTNDRVDILTDSGKYKSTYEILKDIAAVWDDIVSNQGTDSAALLELIGGKRNANVVAAILENFEIAEDALRVATESTGSAIAENEKHLNSIHGTIAKFTAQFESLSATFINSEFVKGIVNFGTFLLQTLEVVGNLVNMLGGLSNVLFTIAGIILTIKIDSIVGRLTTIAGSIKNLTFLTGTFGTTFKQCFDMARIDGANNFRATLTGIAGGFDAVTTSASAAQIAVGAFVALFSIATILSNAITQAEQATKSANEQLINAKIAAVEESESLYDLYAAYETAKAGLTDNEASKKALQTAAENLAVALGYEKDAVDDLNDSYDELTANELSIAVSDAKIAVDTAEKNLVGLMDTFKDSTEKQLISMWGYSKLGVDVMFGSQEERAKNLIATYDLLVAEQRRLVEAGTTESIGYKNIASSIEYLRPQVEALTSANETLADASQRYNDIINGTVSGNNAAADSTGKVVSSAEEAANKLEAVMAKMAEGSSAVSKRLSSALGDLASEDGKVYASTITEIGNAIAEYEDGYTSWTSQETTYHILADAAKEYKLSVDELLTVLVDLGLVQDDSDSSADIYDDAITATKARISSLEDERKEILASNSALYEKVKAILAVGDAYNEIANGNVDYNKRPLITPEQVRKFYPEFDGEIATTYSQGITIGEGDYLYSIDITPILEDGTILSQDALDEYVGTLVTDNGVAGVLESDKYNLITNIQPGDYDEEYWTDYLNRVGDVKQTHWELVKQLQQDTGLSWNEILNQYNGIQLALDENTASIETNKNALAVYETLYDSISADAEQLATNFAALGKEAKAVDEAISNQLSNGSITLETYEALIAASGDYASCIEYENGYMQLNTQKARELINAKTELQILELEQAKAFEAANYQRIAEMMENAAESDSVYRAALEAELKVSEKLITKYRIMQSELAETLSAYNQWKSAQNDPESGDMYDDTITALKQIQEGLKSGKVGTAKFEAAVEFLIPEANRNDVSTYVESLKRYISEDVTGVSNFISDAITQGLMVDDGAGNITIVSDATIQDFCEKLKITPSMAQAIFGELEEYGWEFDWTAEDFIGVVDPVQVPTEVDMTALAALQDQLADYRAQLAALENDPLTLQADVTALEEKIAITEQAIVDAGGVVPVDTTAAEGSLKAVQEDLDQIAEKADTVAAKVIGDMGASETVVSLQAIINKLIQIDNKTIRDKHYNVYQHTITDDSGASSANGTSSAKGGRTLVGELGPELVVSGDRYYTVGSNGAEFVNLKRGDMVFNHVDTQKILAGKSGVRGQALRNGTDPKMAYFGEDGQTILVEVKTDEVYVRGGGKDLSGLTGQNGGSYGAGSGGSGGGSNSDEESWFERQLKDHKHLVEMDKESQSDYLDWLEEAYQKAYEEGIIDIDKFYQYEEEVYKGRLDLVEQAEKDAKSSIDDLVEYRIKMLKQEIEDEKDAVKKKLDALKEFYDKQREMLQDQYDEEKYLEEQAEKRKSVSDIRAELSMLERDDSAWAQRRRIELQEQLSEAEKELNDFERDHALDNTLDMLDEQQASQEALLQAEIDALDEKLNDPHALFNQALADIKNNTEELYNAFIEYNRNHGTGNDEDISDMWEEAYKADLDYQETHNGEHSDGIAIGNYTGYDAPETTSPAQPESPSKSEQAFPHGKASDVSGDIGVGSSGEQVRAIQYALNALGFGNSGTQSCDGEFGSGTQTAVRAFQSAMGITSDGIVGTNTKAKFRSMGYSMGTRSASPGIHMVDELGPEFVFESSDGNRYRVFNGGEKVLNANATNFLYEFANHGRDILSAIIRSLSGGSIAGKINGVAQVFDIDMGDIIVQGNADSRTVSQIRREQRHSVDYMLKEIGRLKR